MTRTQEDTRAICSQDNLFGIALALEQDDRPVAADIIRCAADYVRTLEKERDKFGSDALAYATAYATECGSLRDELDMARRTLSRLAYPSAEVVETVRAAWLRNEKFVDIIRAAYTQASTPESA